MTFITTDIDFAYDEDTIDEAAARVMREFRLNVMVTKEEGPSGWPVVRLMGDPSDIATFFYACYRSGDDSSDLETLVALLGGTTTPKLDALMRRS